jgi:hypothetical protein
MFNCLDIRDSFCVKAKLPRFPEVYQGDDKVDIIHGKYHGFFAQLFGRNNWSCVGV